MTNSALAMSDAHAAAVSLWCKAWCKLKVNTGQGAVDCSYLSGLESASSLASSCLEQEPRKGASGCKGSISQPNHAPCSHVG